MKRGLAAATAALVLLLSAGCGEVTPSAAAVPTDKPIGIAELLTEQQLYAATGLHFGAAQQAAVDEIAYFTADQSAAVYIAARKTTAAEYEEMVAQLSQSGNTATEAPNLCERAVWFADALDLLVFTGEYTLDVRVEYATPRPDDSLLATRQLAALLAEQL